MRKTKGYMQGRFERFVRAMPPPDGHHWTLSIYNPGDGKNRYQIQLIRDEGMGEVISFPPHGHWPASAFSDYLDGLLAGIEDIPLIKERFYGKDE